MPARCWTLVGYVWLYLNHWPAIYMSVPIYMATPKILSEEEIQELLEDRQNGMGLQKLAKKYGVGIPKIRRLEKENGLEIVPAKPVIRQLSIEDIQRHFQEVQESFAIVLEELQKTREELLDKIPVQEKDQIDELLENAEDVEEELEDLGEKMDWQIAGSTLFAFVGLVIGGLALWKKEEPKQRQYYRPPVVEIPRTPKKKIPEME